MSKNRVLTSIVLASSLMFSANIKVTLGNWMELQAKAEITTRQ